MAEIPADNTKPAPDTDQPVNMGRVKIYLLGYVILLIGYVIFQTTSSEAVKPLDYLNSAFPGWENIKSEIKWADLLKSPEANRKIFTKLVVNVPGGRRYEISPGSRLMDKQAIGLARLIVKEQAQLRSAEELAKTTKTEVNDRRSVKILNFSKEGFYADLPWAGILTIYNIFGLFLLLVTFVRSPIYAMLDERQTEIKDALAIAKHECAEAEKVKQKYEELIVEVEEERKKLAANAVGEMKEEREHILKMARHEAEGLLQNINATIEAEVITAAQRLRHEVAEEAVNQARDILLKDVDKADHDQAVAAFLTEIDEVKV
jgi:ATP synthase F0 subunit b